MKRKTSILLASMTVVAMFSTASALAYTINDDPNAPGSLVLEGDNGVRTGDWVDVVDEVVSGGLYEGYGIDVTFSGQTIQFDLYTNFPGFDTFSGFNFYVADLFLDMDQDGIFDFGVVLNSQTWENVALAGETQLAGGLYANPTWYTSADFYDGYNTGNLVIYGESYDQNAPKPVPVAVESGIAVADASFTVSPLLLSGNNPNYVYSFSLDTSWLGGVTGPFNVFWGGETCGNDVITGTAPVPEPATMLLFGSGLLGLAASRRKIKS